MESKNYDDETSIFDQANMDDLRKMMAQPDVLSAALHKPGSVIEHSDGRKYIVDADGKWRRLALEQEK